MDAVLPAATTGTHSLARQRMPPTGGTREWWNYFSNLAVGPGSSTPAPCTALCLHGTVKPALCTLSRGGGEAEPGAPRARPRAEMHDDSDFTAMVPLRAS